MHLVLESHQLSPPSLYRCTLSGTHITAITTSMAVAKLVFLVWGGEGWVATHLKTLLESQGMSLCVIAILTANRHNRKNSLHDNGSYAE